MFGPTHEARPSSGNITQNRQSITGANSTHISYPFRVDASISGDEILGLVFQMPPTLPTGTPKLRLKMNAAATTGSTVIRLATMSTAAEEGLGSQSRTNETDETTTWSAGDSDVIKVVDITLSATAPVQNEQYEVDVTFRGGDASYTLAVDLNVIDIFLIFD